MQLCDFESSTLFAGLMKPLLKLFYISCLVPSLAWANSYSTLVFGPVSYERDDARPIPVHTNFSVADLSSPYVLRIQNNNPKLDVMGVETDSSSTVSSALVTLNGEPVVGPRDFSKQFQGIDKPVELREENTLTVELRGEPGSGLTLSSIKQVECPSNGCVPHIIHPVLETQYRATLLVPTTGGAISTVDGNGTRITLTIPDGGLVENTEISITPVSYIAGLPLTEGLASAVQFEPDGLLLAKPATLTLEFPPGIDASALLGFGWTGNGENFHLQPVSVSGNHISTLVVHFSGAGAGSGDPENADAATQASTLLESSALSTLEIEKARLEATICAGELCTDEETVTLTQAIAETVRTILTHWLESVLQLTAGSAISEEHLYHGMVALLGFEGWAEILDQEYYNSDAAYADRQLARSQIAAGIVAQLHRINETCDASHDINILVLQHRMKAARIVEQVHDLLEASGLKMDDFGCQLIINVEGFPAEIDKNGEEALFNITLRHRTSNLLLEKTTGHVRPGRPNQTGCGVVDDRTGEYFFTTDISGRALNSPNRIQPGQAIDEFKFTAGVCGESDSTAIVRIKIDSNRNPKGGPHLAFVGKTLVLEANLTDSSLIISPANQSVEIGESIQFAAEVPGANNPTFAWEATGGTITQDGLFTAGFIPGDYTVTVTHQETLDRTGTSITVEGTAISVSPTSSTLSSGGTEQFSATVLGPDNTSVIWTAQGGSIDSNGLYTAGNNPGQFFITATSIADPSVVAVASVTILDAPVNVASEYGGTATDSRFPNATSQQEVRIFIQEISPGSYSAIFHYRYRPDLGRGAQRVAYNITLDGNTLSGVGQTNGAVVEFTGVLNGDAMTGTAFYSVSDSISPNCLVNGCFWEFEVLASP